MGPTGYKMCIKRKLTVIKLRNANISTFALTESDTFIVPKVLKGVIKGLSL